MSKLEFSADELELRARNFVRALDPRRLLVNVCGPRFSRPDEREFRVGLGGGYAAGYGKQHDEAPAWAQLRRFFEGDSRVQAALAEAGILGLHGDFGVDQEANVHAFQYVFHETENACALIRDRAFQDKISFPGAASAWQEKFDLYLRQNWTRDDASREAYRTNFDLVDWPAIPENLWPLQGID